MWQFFFRIFLALTTEPGTKTHGDHRSAEAMSFIEIGMARELRGT